MWRIRRWGNNVESRFLLTHPLWDVTLNLASAGAMSLDFYSHIPCGMWRDTSMSARVAENFYSHIPCGMWPFHIALLPHLIAISTHTSLVGCDDISDDEHNRFTISTHTSLVGCDCGNTVWQSCLIISTHTSLVGCDIQWISHLVTHIHFYSHIPCGMWLLYIVYYSLSIPIYHEMDL